MVHSADSDGKIVQLNDYWLSILGYKEEEVIGCFSTDFLTDESKKFAKVVLPIFIAEKNIKNIPYQFVKKNGEKVSILMTAALMEDSDGNTFSIAISTEVTNLIKDRMDSESSLGTNPTFDINKKLIKLRHDNGVTQEKMAEILDTSLRTYQRLEHGETHLTVVDLHKIAAKFNISALRFLMSMDIYEHKGFSSVLIVEDEKVLAEIFQDDLVSWGLEVDVARNGVEALELLKLKSFDVLITDINMPQMNGFELIDSIKHSYKYDVKKIIVVSGLDEDLIKKKVPKEVAIFPKPVAISDLKHTLFEPYLA